MVIRYFYKHFGDIEPVEVFIIQEVKRKESHEVEINRDPNAKAGHWKNYAQLIIQQDEK